MATASVPDIDWSRRADLRVRVLVAVGVAGLLATGLTAWAVATSPILLDPKSAAIWRSLICAAYVTVGLYTWWLRPASRLGPLLTGNGFLFAAHSLNTLEAPAAYTMGVVLWAVYVVYTANLLLSYPSGRLESGLQRTFIRAYALSAAVLTGLLLVLSPTFPSAGANSECGTRCPSNPLAIGNAEIGTALLSAWSVVFTIALFGLTMLLFDKARAAGPVMRRRVAPVTAVFIATIVWFVVSLYVVPAYPGTLTVVDIVTSVLGLAIPIAMLLGQVVGDRSAAISLGQIAVRGGGKPLTPGAVQAMIRDALGDPTLELAIWDHARGGYVDSDGAPVTLPSDTHVRAVTELIRDGRPLAALLHDPSLDTDSDVVQGLAATSLLLLDNAKLVEELRGSRRRIAETGDRERRRLERDLHDGAQQCLVAIQIKLRLLEESTDNDTIAEKIEAISDDAQEAVEELRRLAHGIYPPALTDHGVVDAVRWFATGAPLRIDVVDNGIGRCPRPIESAIYFCSMEAIQNVIKHAGDGARATITFERDGTRAAFAISDDGNGMDVSAPGDGDGDGLVGMRDRVGAVGGELRITSTPAVGTTVRGSIPLENGTATTPNSV